MCLMQVGEIPAKYAMTSCEEAQTELPSASNILRVKVEADREYLFLTARQKVTVQQVYKGTELTGGQTIYLTSDRWQLSMFDEIKSVECGFVNVMQIGSEYLVFVADQVEDLEGTRNVYRLYEQTAIVPVFNYASATSKIEATSEDNSYVSYKLVKDNAFFAEDEEGLAALEGLRAEMLNLYLYPK